MVTMRCLHYGGGLYGKTIEIIITVETRVSRVKLHVDEMTGSYFRVENYRKSVMKDVRNYTTNRRPVETLYNIMNTDFQFALVSAYTVWENGGPPG